MTTAETDRLRVRAPGHQETVDALMALHDLHHPRSGPVSTIWDDMLPAASLWPAFSTDFRGAWAEALSTRDIDDEGYVATHQHPSTAHPRGWPFPFWYQGSGGFGWHFTDHALLGPPWNPPLQHDAPGWELTGVDGDRFDASGWHLTLHGGDATLAVPPLSNPAEQSPFVQVRWRWSPVGDARAWLCWATDAGSEQHRAPLPVPRDTASAWTLVPLAQHPGWRGTITRCAIEITGVAPGTEVCLEGVFSTYDTRHNVNNAAYVLGCATYFRWTRDIAFLAANIDRMRTALRFNRNELGADEHGVIRTPWPGHCGRSGLDRSSPGPATTISGRGIGNNYWDLLPFGGDDCYATMRHAAAADELAAIERFVAEHPELDLPAGDGRFDSAELAQHAETVRTTGRQRFWNAATGRFVACVDRDGVSHDYGFTFLNLEAIAFGFASDEQARSVMEWIDGSRIVDGDDSQGRDIYRFRFAPRASTRRNIDWYGWYWPAPETIEFGGQVQDGGAILGTTYHDVLARLLVLGPDNAARRLGEVARWFAEVQHGGGYRAYYAALGVPLQGGGPAGGLGFDEEFVESAMVPLVLVDGFLGIRPTPDGCVVAPRLPSTWPELDVEGIRVHGQVLRVRAGPQGVHVERLEGSEPLVRPFVVSSPDGTPIAVVDATG